MSTIERGANTCIILLKWKLSLISMHLDYLLNFTKSCVIVTQSQLHGNQVYVLIPRGLFTRNTNAFPDFNLSSHHWKFIFYIVTRTAPFASYLDSE